MPNESHDDWMYKQPDEPTSRPHFTRDNVHAVEAIFQRHTMYRPELRANAMYMQAEMYGTVSTPLRHELQEAGFTVVVINHYPNIVIIWRPHIPE